MGLFGRKSAVGLVIDAEEVRAVELRGSHRMPTLTACGRVPLPEGIVVKGMINQPEVVAQALEELWATAGIKDRQVILGIANPSIMVRFGTFPKVPEDKIAQMIRYQAKDYLPVALDNIVFDHTILKQIAGDGSALLELMLVGAQRDMLDDFLTTLSMAQLKPQDIDVTSLALLHVLPETAEEEMLVIVDLANGLSSITVVEKGLPRLVRLLSISILEAAHRLGCSLEELVSILDTAETAEIAEEAIYGWIESLAGEIRSSLNYYFQGKTDSDAVGQILLTGRGARLKGITEQLEMNLDIPTRILRPLDNIKVASGLYPLIYDIAPDFAVSIGLARRGLKE